MNPAATVRQDIWLAYLIGWGGGLLLIGIYISIFLFYPDKTLIEILQTVFGKCLGGIISLLYIWYFIHLAALVLRNFTEFAVIALYPETPKLFIVVCFIAPIVYLLLNGFEILARLSEILVPFIPVLVVILFLLLAPCFQPDNLLPILEKGMVPVLQSSLVVLTFPFGESILFLMVFPLLNEKDNLVKIAYLSFVIAGVALFLVFIRDLMVLGPQVLSESTFPPMISTRLIPNLNITLDALIGIQLMIGGGIKITICFYAAVQGIKQLFNQQDYKIFVWPIVVAIVGLSVWIYDNVFDMIYWANNIYPWYALFFQLVIPLLLLLVIRLRSSYSS